MDELNNAYNTLQEKMNSLEEKVQSKYNNQISQWNETYIRNQLKEDQLAEQLTMDLNDSFTGK